MGRLRRGQDDLARQARLNRGLCPTHGVVLVQHETLVDGNGIPCDVVVACSRADCDFTAIPKRGTKLWAAITKDTKSK